MTDSTELRHRAFQSQQLFFRQRRQVSQMRANEHGNEGSGRHPPSDRPIAQKKVILGSQAYVQPRIPHLTLYSNRAS